MTPLKLMFTGGTLLEPEEHRAERNKNKAKRLQTNSAGGEMARASPREAILQCAALSLREEKSWRERERKS